MKAKKLFFMECHLAGRKYHDVDEVWEELKVGTKLVLKRDLNNRFDTNAVAIMYERCLSEEDGPKTFLLGYIPRDGNEVIAKLLEMGWDNIFECRINKINPEVHPEEQIRLTIRIFRNQQT